MEVLKDKFGCQIEKGDQIKCDWIVNGKPECHIGRVTSINFKKGEFRATYSDGNKKQLMEDFKNHIIKVNIPSKNDEYKTMRYAKKQNR